MESTVHWIRCGRDGRVMHGMIIAGPALGALLPADLEQVQQPTARTGAYRVVAGGDCECWQKRPAARIA